MIRSRNTAAVVLDWMTACLQSALSPPPLLDGRDADPDESSDIPPGEAEVGKLLQQILGTRPAAVTGADSPLKIVATLASSRRQAIGSTTK